MSFIPNTTPTPNWLYNGEMRKMNETQLKVVLLVTRKTLGWFDPKTSERKSQDYISQKQFMEFTGKSHTAIAHAIQCSVKAGWIIARDKIGNLCDTPDKRRRRKVWYQLGSVFTNKLSKQDSCLDTNLSNKTHKSKQHNDTNLSNKVDNTKETITKETIQKKRGKAPHPLIDKFLIYLKEKAKVIDTAKSWQRKDTWILIVKMKSLAKEKVGREPTDNEVWNGLKFLVDTACADKFHSQRAGKIRYLYENIGVIAKSKQTNQRKVII